MGTNEQSLRRWENDRLLDCSPDDRIFGFSIRASEVLHLDRGQINDEVLENMLMMGLLDPKPGAPAWSEPLSLRQGLRLMSSAIVRVVKRVCKMEKQVRRWLCLVALID